MSENKSKTFLPLDNFDNAEAWMRGLAASARNMKLKDNGMNDAENGGNAVTDIF